MSCEVTPKRQRTMILSGDEGIINEIKNSRHASLCQSVLIEPNDADAPMPSAEVGTASCFTPPNGKSFIRRLFVNRSRASSSITTIR